MLDVLNAANKVDVSKVDDLLATISKYERIMDKFLNLYSKLEKSGVINAALRIAGKRAGVDLDKPAVHPLSIVASSPEHKVLFNILNQMSPQDVQQLYYMLLNSMQQNADKNIEPSHKESEKISKTATKNTQSRK